MAGSGKGHVTFRLIGCAPHT